RPARPLPAAGAPARRPPGGRPLALPAALVPPLRRLRYAPGDLPASAGRGAGPGRPHLSRAVPRLADAAPAASDAALLPGDRLPPESVRGGGATSGRADASARLTVARLGPATNRCSVFRRCDTRPTRRPAGSWMPMRAPT